MAHAVHIQLRCLPLVEMIPLAFAPLTVAFGEGGLAGQVDTLIVPKGHDKIDPLLATIGAIRAGEQLVYPRKDLVSERNEVVLQRRHVFHVQIVLP